MSLTKKYEKINETRKICNEDLYEEVAEELGVPIELVKEVIDANSRFTVSVIYRGAFENIILPYLGKVKAKLKSVQVASGNVNRPE